MATLPQATTRVEEQASAAGAGLDLLCVLAPVSVLADMKPRLYGNADSLYEVHGPGLGVEFLSLYAKPVLFVGMPIDAPGAIGRVDNSGNTGTSVVGVSAGVSGCFDDHHGVVTVERGGTVGTDQILLRLSLDGGTTSKRVRLGAGTSYAIPFLGATLTFAPGALVTGDTVLEWHGTAPRVATTDYETVRGNLAQREDLFRSILNLSEAQVAADATAFRNMLAAYEEQNERYVFGRQPVRDLRMASMSVTTRRMQDGPELTFATGATETITRGAGSWLDDGFGAGDAITVSGTAANDGAYSIVTATALVLEVAEVVSAEVVSGAVVIGSATLEIDATAKTLTLSRGSWLVDGFAAGDTITVAGTAANDGNYVVDTATATTLTVTGTLAGDETVAVSSTSLVTFTESPPLWAAALDAEFALVPDSPRLDLGLGRGRRQSPWTGYVARRSVQWAATRIEYAHDLHIPTWQKGLGPTDFSLLADDGTLQEWDDKYYGEAGVAGRFTCFRRFGSDRGAYVALSLTRGDENSLRSQTHNMAVANLVQTLVQRNTENAAIGQSLLLRTDGTGRATQASLSDIEAKVNGPLQQQLLSDLRGEGPRASAVQWRADPEVDYSVPEPLMLGTAYLTLNGTVHSVYTAVRIQRS